MALLAYTTQIAASKTVGEIIGMLASHGARSVTTDYDGQGNPVAVLFAIQTLHGERSFRLPMNGEAIWRVMVAHHHQGKIPNRFVTREQAARVGWRIIRQWVEAQLALIETDMASLTEIMLAYMIVRDDITVYDALLETRLMLGPGTEQEAR
jgi:hypothetical protein